MTLSPNHTAGVQSVPRIPERMDQQSKISTTNQSNNMRNGGSTAQNGISDVPIGGNSSLNLLCESDRLRTFENWPVPFMNINDLAAAGFYYLNKGDLVRCSYCSIEVGRWVEGDDPFADHKRLSPHCRYILQRRSSASENSSLDPSANGFDVCGPFGIDIRKPVMNPESNAKEAALQKLGIHTDRAPTFPNYSTNEARLRSFQAWPLSMKIKPDMLSEAGYFYTGKGDQTICFHCGGGLKDWEDTDDPWVEHARHFNRCNYVLLIKGKEFVDEACGKKTEVLSLTREEMKAVVESHSEVVPVPATDVAVTKRNVTQESCSTQTADSVKDVDVKNKSDSTLCRVCYTEERNAVFLPCGHLVVCGKCGIGLKTCVVCRKPCEARVRVFLS